MLIARVWKKQKMGLYLSVKVYNADVLILFSYVSNYIWNRHFTLSSEPHKGLQYSSNFFDTLD